MITEDLVKTAGFRSGMEKTASGFGFYEAAMKRHKMSQRKRTALISAALIAGGGLGAWLAARAAKQRQNAA